MELLIAIVFFSNFLSVATEHDLNFAIIDRKKAEKAKPNQAMHFVDIDIQSDFDSKQELTDYYGLMLTFTPVIDKKDFKVFTLEDKSRMAFHSVRKVDGADRLAVKFSQVSTGDFGEYTLCACPRSHPKFSEKLCDENSCAKIVFELENEMEMCSPAPSDEICSKDILHYDWVKPNLVEVQNKIENFEAHHAKNLETAFSEASEECRILLKSAMCVIFYPKCNSEENKNKILGINKLCKQDCLDVFDLCSGTGWEAIREKYTDNKTVAVQFDLFMGNLTAVFKALEFDTGATFENGRKTCSALTDTDSCVSIQAAQAKRAIKAENATRDCYNKTDGGEFYRGDASHTQNKEQCLKWTSAVQYIHLNTYSSNAVEYIELYSASNFCRNPANVSTLQRKSRPWCFYSQSDWGFCSISPCVDDENPQPSFSPWVYLSTTSMVLIFSAVASLILLASLLIFILLCVKCRRKKELPEEQFFKNIKNSEYNYACKDETGMWNYERSQIAILSRLGQGEFGIVHKAEIRKSSDHAMLVAVKALKVEATSSERQNFRQEAELMNKYSHENIVKFYGVCFEGSPQEPLYMIFEFMPSGDLHEYLTKLCPSTPSNAELEREAMDIIVRAVEKHLPLFHSICIQIAKGLAYLAKRQHIHRDIAARNVLLSEDAKSGILTVKLSDFGLSRNIYNRNYYRMKSKSLLPVRWMPPEAITYGTFTTASDVYSFGIVLWEIFTFGTQPYDNILNEDVVPHILKPEILKQPTGCPDSMYEIMKHCWCYHSKNRPKAEELVEQLQFEAARDRIKSPRTMHRAQLPQHNYNNMEAIVKNNRQNAAKQQTSQISPGANAFDPTKAEKGSRFTGFGNPGAKNPPSIPRPQFQIRPSCNNSNMPNNKNLVRGNFNRFNHANAAWRSPMGTFPPQVQTPNGQQVFNMSDLSNRGMQNPKMHNFDASGPRGPPSLARPGFPSNNQQSRGAAMQYNIGSQGAFPGSLMHKYPPNGPAQNRKGSGLPQHFNNNRSADQLNNFSAC